MIHTERCGCGAEVTVRAFRIAAVRVAVRGWRKRHLHPDSTVSGVTEAAEPGQAYRGEHGGTAQAEMAMEPAGVDVAVRRPIGFVMTTKGDI